MGCAVAKIAAKRLEELEREKQKYIQKPTPSPEAFSFKPQGQQQPTHQVTHAESLRKLTKPPQITRKSYAFHLPSTEWGMASDDHGNPYFYNYESGESQWTCPPELQHLDLPEHRLSFTVVIPDDAIPGVGFETEVEDLGFEVEVLCPIDASPGELLELICPEDTGSVEMAGWEEEENYDYSLEEDDETGYESFDETEEPAIKAWYQFSEEKGIDTYTVETDVASANSVLLSVSKGCYSNDLIQQISWAYRLHQLEDALRDCILTDGNLEDTSKYDNCDGIPRYKGGFIEWWKDVRSKRDEILTKQRAGILGEGLDDLYYEKTSVDYSRLEALVSSGDDKAFVSGLIERQKAVEKELDSLRARSLAIVSIDSGPSKESLDSIYQYVQSEMSLENWSDPDPDEMDEMISNVIEQRHRFVVDDIIQMVLLEEELQQLLLRINEFKARKSFAINSSEGVDNDGEEGDAVVAPRDNDNSNVDENMSGSGNLEIDSKDEDLQKMMELMSAQSLEARKLENDLLARKSANSKRLAERIAMRKNARAQELLRENVGMSMLEINSIVDAEFFEEETSEHRKLECEMADEMKAFYKQSLAAIRSKSQEEADRLSNLLAAQKESRAKSLAARLEKRKRGIIEKKEKEGLDVSSEIEAIEKEKFEGMIAIEEDSVALTREKREKLMKLIRSQHEAESSRLEDELNSQRERQKRELRAKLNFKISERSKDIEKTARRSGDEITALEARALAELETNEDLSNGLHSIDANFDADIDKEKETLLQSLKSIHENEVLKLNDILENSQRSQRQHLQERLKNRKSEASLTEEEQRARDEAALSGEGVVAGDTDIERATIVEAFEAQLSNLKNAHAQDNEKLMSALSAQKSLQSKSLRDRLERKEKQKREEKLKATSTMLSKDESLQRLKARHARLLSRLEAFLESKKNAEMDKLRVDNARSQRKKARALMLYNNVKEAFVSGYKKKCLYEFKLAKESASDRSFDYFGSRDFQDAAVSNAIEQLLKRCTRDAASLVERQLKERSDLLKKLSDDSATGSRILDAEANHDDQCFEKILIEVERSVMTIAAIFIDNNLLAEEQSVADGVGEDDEDEMYLNDIDRNHNESSEKFGDALKGWFQNAIELIELYSDSAPTLSLHLSDVHIAMQVGVDISKVIEVSGDLRFNLLKPSIPLIVKSFVNSFKTLPAYASDDEKKRILSKDLTQMFGVVDTNEDFTAAFDSAATNRDNSKDNASSSPVRYSLPSRLKNNFKTDSADSYAKNIDTCIDLYKKALDKFLHEPFVGTDKLKIQKGVVKKLFRQKSSASIATKRQMGKRNSSGIKSVGKEQKREEIMVDNLKSRVDRKKREVEKERSDIGMIKYDDAYNDVRKFVLETKEDLGDIGLDALMRVVEMLVRGETIKGIDDYRFAQKEVEQAEGRHQAQRMVKQAQDDEDKLDILLKLEKAKKQQLLQKRLLAKKNIPRT